VGPGQLDQLLHPTFDPKADKKLIATGRPPRRGAAVGSGVYAKRPSCARLAGEKIILVRREKEPADIGGALNARLEGILTSTGGMTQPRGGRRPRHWGPPA